MKPKLLMSMPSSGSDFLAKSIQQATNWSYYQKEWFNPICNLHHYDRLLKAGFGCETASGYSSIFNPRVEVENLLSEFLGRGHVFNKEVFCFAKKDWFLENFDVVVLTRKEDSMFPPSRLRVLQWYESIFLSSKGDQVPNFSFQERVRAGYQVAYQSLLSYDVPQIDYDQMLQLEGLDHIQDWLGGARVLKRLEDIIRAQRVFPYKPKFNPESL